LVFSQIIVVISRRSTLETREIEEDNNTRQAMQTLGIPSSLQLRIFAHYTYERVHRGHGTVEQLLGGLSDQLNFELHLARHYRLVTAVPFFKSSHPYVLREIVLVLTDVIFLPGDWICRLGDEGKEMYFLHKGACSVLTEDMLTMLRQVIEGDYFGEISLLTGMQRTAYVRADTFCMVAELAKDKFDQIMRRFPQQLGVIVSGFSEEQKALLLQIRQRLHQQNELMINQHRLSNIPTTPSGDVNRPKLSILSTPSAAFNQTPSNGYVSQSPRTNAQRPQGGPAQQQPPASPVPASNALQVPGQEVSKALSDSKQFGPVTSTRSGESSGTADAGQHSQSMPPQMAPLASVGSSLVRGVRSLQRQFTQKLGKSGSKLFGEADIPKSPLPEAIAVEDYDEGDEHRVVPALSEPPPLAASQQSSRRPSVLGSLACLPQTISNNLFQRRLSLSLQGVAAAPPPPPPPPLPTTKEGLQRRKTLQDMNGIIKEDNRVGSPLDEVDEDSSDDLSVQRKLEAECNGAHEVSVYADGIREADRHLTQVSKSVEEAHHEVYAKCQLLEQTWLMKRAEIRDERADMGATLQALAEQIAECTNMLMRIVTDDTQDDVALKAIDIVERDLDHTENDLVVPGNF